VAIIRKDGVEPLLPLPYIVLSLYLGLKNNNNKL